MSTLIVFVAVLVALVAFDLAALHWGVDTRRADGSDWDWSREWSPGGAGLSGELGTTSGKPE